MFSKCLLRGFIHLRNHGYATHGIPIGFLPQGAKKVVIQPRLERQKGTSIFRQLTKQFEYAIFTGKMNPGEKLPSVRELSKNLGINPLTVTKVYVALEKKGLVLSYWGKGTFVKEKSGLKEGKHSKAHLQEMVDKFISEAMPLVNRPDELLTLFKRRLQGG